MLRTLPFLIFGFSTPIISACGPARDVAANNKGIEEKHVAQQASPAPVPPTVPDRPDKYEQANDRVAIECFPSGSVNDSSQHGGGSIFIIDEKAKRIYSYDSKTQLLKPECAEASCSWTYNQNEIAFSTEEGFVLGMSINRLNGEMSERLWQAGGDYTTLRSSCSKVNLPIIAANKF